MISIAAQESSLRFNTNVDKLFNVNISLAVHLPHAGFKRIWLELHHLERIVSCSHDPPLVKNNEPLLVYSVNDRNNASEIDPTTEEHKHFDWFTPLASWTGCSGKGGAHRENRTEKEAVLNIKQLRLHKTYVHWETMWCEPTLTEARQDTVSAYWIMHHWPLKSFNHWTVGEGGEGIQTASDFKL